jgi:dipeptidyl aminopeptidase/acylaminoacyl peptidase
MRPPRIFCPLSTVVVDNGLYAAKPERDWVVLAVQSAGSAARVVSPAWVDRIGATRSSARKSVATALATWTSPRSIILRTPSAHRRSMLRSRDVVTP